MKKLLLILILFTCTSGCVAQKTEPAPEPFASLTVIAVYGDELILRSDTGKDLEATVNPNAVRIPENLQIEEERIYKVKFRYLENETGKLKRRIEILGYAIDPRQAMKDGDKIAEL